MDPNSNTEAQPTEAAAVASPAETPPPATDTGKVFTQVEVDRIAAAAREQGRKSAFKATTAAPQPAPTPQPPPAVQATGDEGERVTLRQLKEQLDEERMRRAFDKRAARRGLGDEVSEELFEIFKVQKPADPDEWFERKSTLFGFKAPGQSTAAPTAPTATEHKAPPATTATTAQANISDRGPAASSNARDFEGIFDTDPLRSTPDDFNRLVVKHGREKALQYMSDRVNAYLRTVKLVPDNRRQR